MDWPQASDCCQLPNAGTLHCSTRHWPLIAGKHHTTQPECLPAYLYLRQTQVRKGRRDPTQKDIRKLELTPYLCCACSALQQQLTLQAEKAEEEQSQHANALQHLQVQLVSSSTLVGHEAVCICTHIASIVGSTFTTLVCQVAWLLCFKIHKLKQVV